MSQASSSSAAWVCPRCRASLDDLGGGFACGRCAIHYPIVAGIPDFRVFPDPWIGLEEDRVKALRLEAATAGMSFEEAVRTYWEITPTTPRPLAERFTEHVLRAEARSAEWLAGPQGGDGHAGEGPWLDLGCGTADVAAALSARGHSVVGIDIALRWLVIARKRPGIQGRVELVCCCAEHLPFPDGRFAGALSLGLLEHCTDAQAAVSEAHRVLRPGADLRLRTVNRYALREPHVGVLGVGFMPRRWADAYVCWRSGHRYLHHRPQSPGELRRSLRRAGFEEASVRPAHLLPSEVARLGSTGRRLARGYEWLRSTPVVRGALSWAAPLLEVRGRRSVKDRHPASASPQPVPQPETHQGVPV